MKKINLAIVGCNNMGTKHLNSLNGFFPEKVEIAGILNSCVDSSKKKAEELRVPYFEDIAQITKEAVNLAIIATPATFHDFYAINLLNKGIPCLVEKPLALSVEKCESIIKASKESKTPFMVGYTEIFNPAVTAMKKVLEDRKIKFIKAHRTTIANTRNSDTTIIQNLMLHDISVMYYISGKTIDEIEFIKANVNKERGLHSYAEIIASFSGGLDVELKAEMVNDNNAREMLAIDEEDNEYKIDFLNRELYKNGKLITSGGNSIQEELNHFIHCYISNKEFIANGEMALEIEKLSLKFDEVFKETYQNS